MCSKEHVISILQKPQESQHYIIYWETEIWKSFEKDLNNFAKILMELASNPSLSDTEALLHNSFIP